VYAPETDDPARTHLKSKLDSFDLIGVRSSLLVFIACTLLTSVAAAESPCADTFPDRLREVKAQVQEWRNESKAYEKAKSSPEYKAMEFFANHCRILTELERAVRKLDDPLSFVCDPSAGKKPKALTTKLVAESGGTVELEGPPIHGTSLLDHECSDEDPVDLGLSSDFSDPENAAKSTLVRCYEDSNAACPAAVESSLKLLDVVRRLKAAGKR